jgi:hypothetical protein
LRITRHRFAKIGLFAISAGYPIERVRRIITKKANAISMKSGRK